ncbi:MAG: TetR/AcrR family transcriptional regulator [Candidatus Solibacter usitatus]|nr:TetR/AcrR family transcriptional regulator [Candidatus Solibacter usitatus]
MTQARPRDRARTRHSIIEAVGRLLARQGFKGVGVNAVAREAGVDKVLIYRYFGGIPQLLKAYAEEGGFWPTQAELLGSGSDTETNLDLARRALLGLLRWLRQHPLTLEIMRWELLERNELTRALARHREEFATRLMRTFRPQPDIDLAALGAVLAAGGTYLLLRARTSDVYNGIHLDSEQEWDRLELALDSLISAALA